MALDIDDAKAMVSEIVAHIDYDIWKEFMDEDNQGLDFYDLVMIVEKYIKVNP